jgi:transcription elongation factor Elf1
MANGPQFRIVSNNLAFLGEGQGLLAIQFECEQCGKTVQVSVSKLIKSGVGANVKCHSCDHITYVPPNAGKE